MDNLAKEFKNRAADLAYQVHYNRQLFMKLLAHVIAEDCDTIGLAEHEIDGYIKCFIERLNNHTAKVHFTVDEINDITKILEESKKFI